MTTELTTQPKPSALAAMAERFEVEPGKLLETLKQTAFKGATDAQMMALCVVANEYGLNPFTKEIYAFPDKGGGIVPVIGVDGWYRMVNDHPQFDGVDFTETLDNGKLVSLTATIHRKDRGRPCSVTEYLSECARNTDPWKNQPRRMLRHRAFIQAARIAFGMAGTDPEDVARMEEKPAKARVVTQAEMAAMPPIQLAPAPTDTATTEGGGFTLEEQIAYPEKGAPLEQLEWLLESARMSEAELFEILDRSKMVPAGEYASITQMPEKQIKGIVKSWDLVLGEQKGGEA